MDAHNSYRDSAPSAPPCNEIAGHPWQLDLPFSMHILLLFQFAYNGGRIKEICGAQRSKFGRSVAESFIRLLCDPKGKGATIGATAEFQTFFNVQESPFSQKYEIPYLDNT